MPHSSLMEILVRLASFKDLAYAQRQESSPLRARCSVGLCCLLAQSSCNQVVQSIHA